MSFLRMIILRILNGPSKGSQGDGGGSHQPWRGIFFSEKKQRWCSNTRFETFNHFEVD